MGLLDGKTPYWLEAGTLLCRILAGQGGPSGIPRVETWDRESAYWVASLISPGEVLESGMPATPESLADVGAWV